MQSCADTEKEKTEQIILTADKITNIRRRLLLSMLDIVLINILIFKNSLIHPLQIFVERKICPLTRYSLFCFDFLYWNLWLAVFCCYKPRIENDTFDYRFVYLEKTKDVKEKLLNSLKGSNSEEGLGLQEIVCNIKESKETIKIIKHYMEIIKSEKKKDHQYCRKATFKKVRKRWTVSGGKG